jgi:NADH dehydrogenase/NADH:ubiquinone oxidoreductase subunit G
MKEEASRCLHCDCRDMHTCKLRMHADSYAAVQRRFKTDDFAPVTKVFVHEVVIYEPQKCIKCGICVRLTEKQKEKYGFTFIGRGFDVRIGIPFDETLESQLSETAIEIAKACPTGALASK